MKRILEPESVETLEDVIALDEIVSKDKIGRIMNDWALKAISNIVDPEKEKVSVLEIGCGTARMAIQGCQKLKNIKVVGVDLSDNMIEIGKTNIEEADLSDRISLVKADAKKLPFEDNSFDLVVCANMLHHLEDPTEVINEIDRVVKENGRVFIKDILRPHSFLRVKILVAFFGIFYDKVMKKQYFDSLRAGYSLKEIKEFKNNSRCKDYKLKIYSPHFYTLKK